MARTILMYGVSDTYKTSNIGEFADWIYLTYGKITRLVSADSGWHPIQPQIDRGVIVPWNLSSAVYPLACVVRASEGYWPSKIDKDGKADENTLRKTLPSEWETTDGYPGIGMLAIEGLTMIGEHLMSDLTSKQRQTGEPLIGLFSELGVNFGSASRGSYQFVQKISREYVMRLKSLPCNYALVTSHEGRGEDDAKRPVFGPAIVGKASNEKVASWFGTTIHHEKYMWKVKTQSGKGPEVVRPGVKAFFTTHQDPEIPTKYWPAKTDVSPAVQAELLRTYPEGSYVVQMDETGTYTSGLHSFMNLIYHLEHSVDAPVVDAPVVDAPVVETPVVDTPVVDTLGMALQRSIEAAQHELSLVVTEGTHIAENQPSLVTETPVKLIPISQRTTHGR